MRDLFVLVRPRYKLDLELSALDTDTPCRI